MIGLCRRSSICVVLLQALLTAIISPVLGKLNLEEIAKRYTKRTPGGIHLPIVRIEIPTNFGKRDIGLGDYYDVVYSVLVAVGNVTVPLVLDTGSSDLWIVSDACTQGCNNTTTKLYPQATFQSAGIGIEIDYGDSHTGTYASGLIGYDKVAFAGIQSSSQAFAAINSTTVQAVELGILGIFGINFPLNSVIWDHLFHMNDTSASKRSLHDSNIALPRGSLSKVYDSQRHTFPHIRGAPPAHLESRQSGASPTTVKAILDSWGSRISPFVPRLIVNGTLPQPLVAVTLQRDTVDIGNHGLLSIGELPSGVKTSDLTWVGLRRYSTSDGGLPGPPDSPSESYPYTWEVNIDNVYLDGIQLPATNLTPASIGITALIDTGNSRILGPADSISYINQKLGPNGGFKCTEPHNLTFEIGGKLFPVDPRDFVVQAVADSVDLCTANVASTDPPKAGSFLFSWSLGTPFLKGVLSAFYFGNITYPSKDAPKVGFLSTVPNNAGDLLKAAVASASMAKNFPGITQPAPSGSATSPAVTSTSR